MREPVRQDLVDEAKALAPQIIALRDEIESGRRLPASLAKTMDSKGLMQLYLPRSMGGPEIDTISFYLIVEELSKLEGSVGWCCSLSGALAFFAGWIEPEVGREMFGDDPHVRIGGSFRPMGEASHVDGGYRITGRWDYASGIDHANWIGVHCRVVDGNGPKLTAAGTPQTRMALLPAEHAVILDTWNPMGMLGTGSNDFNLEDVFVPDERTWELWGPAQEPNPLYDPRLFMAATWPPIAANALGMARGAMDAFVKLATESGSTRSTTLLRDRAPIQDIAGRAEAIINSARGYILDSLSVLKDVLNEGELDPGPQIAQVRLATTHGMWEAVKAVDMLFHAAGTNAIHQKYPLERFFRDIHVSVQHGAGLLSNFESGGQVMLGLKPSDPGW
ncbi:MAG: hypothetical protein BZY81_08525 [SAR202 cluster bacterium Io17-Chloro-G4]|nr:MAG: hypothetical protein BZY81_08525 [SAR202 cluster bacterium Io17-Chloro-G4]